MLTPHAELLQKSRNSHLCLIQMLFVWKLYDYARNYLLYICKLKIKNHDVILHYDVTLKQTKCICVNQASLETKPKIMICYNHSVNKHKHPIWPLDAAASTILHNSCTCTYLQIVWYCTKLIMYAINTLFTMFFHEN